MSEAVTHEDLAILRKEIKRLKRKDAIDNRWVVPALITAAMAILIFLLTQNITLFTIVSDLRVDMEKRFSASDRKMDARFSEAAFENEKRFNELDRKLDGLQTAIECLRQKK